MVRPPRSHALIRRPRPDARRGFTLLEVVVVVLIMSLVMAATAVSFSSVFNNQKVTSSRALLGGVQVAGRTVANANSFAFPANLASQMKLQGHTFITGPAPVSALGSMVVSVAQDPKRATIAGFAVRPSDTVCTFMIDQTVTNGSTPATVTFVKDVTSSEPCQAPVACDVSTLISQASATGDGTYRLDATVDLSSVCSASVATVSAPSAPTCAIATPKDSSSIEVTWQAPSGGANLSGFKVLRYAGTVDLAQSPVTDLSRNLLPQWLATGGDSGGTLQGASTPTGVSLSTTTAAARQGSSSLRLAVGQATATGTAVLASSPVAISANQQLVFSAYVARPSTTSTSALYPQIVWLKADGSAALATNSRSKGTAQVLSSTFTRLTATGTAPAGAALARVELVLDKSVQSMTGTAVMLADAFMLESGSTPSTTALPAPSRTSELLSSSLTSWTDTGLTPGAAYTYAVVALDTSTPPLSSTVEDLQAAQSILPHVTLVPDQVHVTPSPVVIAGKTQTQISLTWPATTGADSYVVSRRAAGSLDSFGTVTTVPASAASAGQVSWVDTSITAGVLYEYRVVASVTEGTSSICGTVVHYGGMGPAQDCLTTQDCPPIGVPPAAPVLTGSVVGPAGSGTGDLSWTSPDGAATYQLDRKSSEGGSYQCLSSGTGCAYTGAVRTLATPYEDAAGPGERWTYRVRSVGATYQGTTLMSDWSNEVMLSYTLARPSIKSLSAVALSGDGVSNDVQAVFAPVAGADSYELRWRYSGDASWTSDPAVSVSCTAQCVATSKADLSDGSISEVEVRAVRKASGVTSDWSDLATLTIVLPAPTTAACAVTLTTLTVSWQDRAASQATSYQVNEYDATDGSLLSTSRTSTTTSYTYTLTSGQARRFTVQAYRATTGVKSVPSNQTLTCISQVSHVTDPTVSFKSCSNDTPVPLPNDASLNLGAAGTGSNYRWLWAASSGAAPTISAGSDGWGAPSRAPDLVVPASRTTLDCTDWLAALADRPFYNAAGVTQSYIFYAADVRLSAAAASTAWAWTAPAAGSATPVVPTPPMMPVAASLDLCNNVCSPSLTWTVPKDWTTPGMVRTYTVKTIASTGISTQTISPSDATCTPTASGDSTCTYTGLSTLATDTYASWTLSACNTTPTSVDQCSPLAASGDLQAPAATPYLYPASTTCSSTTSCVSSSSDAVLRWSVASSPDEFRIYRNGSLLVTLAGTLRTYTDTGITAGLENTYQIVAVNTVPTTRASDPSGVIELRASVSTGRVTGGRYVTYTTSNPVTSGTTGWSGAYGVSGILGVCTDIWWEDPLEGADYHAASTKDTFGTGTNTPSYTSNIAGKSAWSLVSATTDGYVSTYRNGGTYTNGTTVSAASVYKLGYALATYGRLGPGYQEALAHYVWDVASDSDEQNNIAASKWNVVNNGSYGADVLAAYNTMVSAATTNYGPFALNVSLVASDKATPVTKLTKGQLVYLKVSVTSATGKVISGSGLEASALTDDGYNPLPVTSWDANGYAYIPYTPLCRDTQSGSNITVYVGDLPEDNLYAYAPSDIGTSKPQQRILRLGMSQTLNKQLTYTYN